MTDPTAHVDQSPGSDLRLLRDYGDVPLDEAIDPAGGIRDAYAAVLPHLDGVDLESTAQRLELLRREAGVVFIAPVDGEQVAQVFPLDPVPRIIGARTWAHLAAGAAQRSRALNALLADVYGDDGREPGTPARIVADGVIPDSVVRGAPGYQPAAWGLAPGGQPRAAVVGLDLLTDEQGRWVVLEDNLQVPSGMAYALANRRTLAAAVPSLADLPPVHESPERLGRLLGDTFRSLAPPRATGRPQVVVLSDGPDNSAWFEHRTLAAEMGVPIVLPDQLEPDGKGIATRTADGRLLPVDVLYRRLGTDELLDGPVADLVTGAVRRGCLTVVNAAGNGVADDKAIYAFVGPMIRYYLGEEPILADVGTWVLADPGQYDAVRGRLGELVVKPVDGAGGEGVAIGPEMTAAALDELEEAVAAAPERFIAQEVIRFSTHPTLIGDALQPRHVDLRLFVLHGAEVVVPPVALSRVALESDALVVNSSQGGGSKDTWICG